MSSSASTWRWYEIGPGGDLSRRGELRLGAGVQGRAQGCTGQGQGDAMRCLPQPGLHPDELALPRQGGLDGVGEQDDQRLRRADPEGRRRADRRLPGAELRQKALASETEQAAQRLTSLRGFEHYAGDLVLPLAA